MKKYVSKEDVQKGLVDPHKPLEQQKEYMSKIEEQERQKEQKKQKKQGYKKRQRKNRPQYNWNKRDVTLDTPIPAEPKKAIPKPDKDKYYDQLNDYRKQLDELYEKKNNLYNEMKFALRNNNENKRTGDATRSKFSAILKEKNNLKKILQEEIENLQGKRDQIDADMRAIKNKIQSLRKPQNFADCSTEQLQRRLEKTEQRLTTEEMNKNQENRVNQKILEMKRALLKSRPEVEVSAEIGRLQNQDDLLFSEMKNLRGEIKKKYDEAKEVRQAIAKIMQDKKSQQQTTQVEVRSPEQIKIDYEAKIQKVKNDRQAIKKKLEKHKDNYFKSLDEYEDYFDLVSYIKMIKQEKEKITKKNQEIERKKKQKEEYQKKKQKEFEEKQKRRQERIKREQQRKKQEQQKRQKLQKERQQFLSRNPHHQQIQTCNQLVQYCQLLKPENAHKKQTKRAEEKQVHLPIQELPKGNKQWVQQIKKGAEVIVSKKMKEDQEGPKKAKKEKKKKEKEEDQKVVTGFTHHIDMTRRFQTVNLLPPYAAAEIDDVIKQLQDKIEIFSKPTEEQIAAFKVKAQRQFDAMHGLGHDKNRKGYKAKGEQQEKEEPEHREKHKSKKYEKKMEFVAEDFPGL